MGFGGFFVNTIISGALLGDFVDFEFQKTATLSDNNQVEVSNKLVNKMNEDPGDASSVIAGVGWGFLRGFVIAKVLIILGVWVFNLWN